LWYNQATMYNWSIDEEKFKKEDPEGYKLWRLTQLINYGLDGEKLNKKEVKKAWPKIKERLDSEEQRLIEFLIWNKKYPLPPKKFFWER